VVTYRSQERFLDYVFGIACIACIACYGARDPIEESGILAEDHIEVLLGNGAQNGIGPRHEIPFTCKHIGSGLGREATFFSIDVSATFQQNLDYPVRETPTYPPHLLHSGT
jgi:hypothetical protein